MTNSTGARLGLTSGWDPGDHGWGAADNLNLRTLDALVNARTSQTRAATPPSSPSLGTLVLVAHSGTGGAFVGHEDKVAVFTKLENGSSAWEYYTPREGWRVVLTSATLTVPEQTYIFRGTDWQIEKADLAILPTGGTTNQVLRKTSGTDYDSSWASRPYITKFVYPGNPASDSVLFADVMTDSVEWAAAFAGSKLVVEPTPVTDLILRVYVGATQIGSVTVSAGATDGTFATTGGTAKNAVTGDLFKVLAPATPVATTFTLIAGSFVGTH